MRGKGNDCADFYGKYWIFNTNFNAFYFYFFNFLIIHVASEKEVLADIAYNKLCKEDKKSTIKYGTLLLKIEFLRLSNLVLTSLESLNMYFAIRQRIQNN